MRPLSLLFVWGFLCSCSWGCLWDSDTLGYETKRFPNTVDVIVGRFERNPSLYFEMRLKRVAAVLKLHPERLALYDDAAVAADRLGKHDEAITWMEKKREQIYRAGLDRADRQEHLYRYYANVGTFWAHRWIKKSEDRREIQEVVRARDFIAKAIEINPDAHFGRERYQLYTLEWIVNSSPTTKNKQDVETPSLTDYLEKKKLLVFHATNKDEQRIVGDAIRGLSGLIVLGNAWESIDVFEALARALGANELTSVSYLAQNRIAELRQLRRRSIIPDAVRETAFGSHGLRNENQIRERYKQLRDNAEAWSKHRTEFMLSRLKAGLHPDTDTEFWAGYQEVPRITFYGDLIQQPFVEWQTWVILVVLGLLSPSLFRKSKHVIKRLYYQLRG